LSLFYDDIKKCLNTFFKNIKKIYRNKLKKNILVLDHKNSICSGGNFFGREDSAFSKNGQNKCPFLTFPKKSWEKKEKFASTCVGPVFWHFFANSPKSPTLCSIWALSSPTNIF
jgi:hypothetical protein